MWRLRLYRRSIELEERAQCMRDIYLAAHLVHSGQLVLELVLVEEPHSLVGPTPCFAYVCQVVQRALVIARDGLPRLLASPVGPELLFLLELLTRSHLPPFGA